MAAPTDDGKKETKDGKAFYGYLYEKQKPFPAPKPLLNALLRAVALHIIDSIGDKNDKNLTPHKLAAFYKIAGHNYDGLFIEMPPQSISFIYQVQGCQHILVQPGSDTEAPTIPALTTKGFVRWQSIQILLEPQTHVPILQYAVKHWALKNPDDGTPFPADLPKEAFPLETDADTDLWHQECAVRLREQATPKEDPKPSFTEPKDGRPGPRDGPKAAFADRKVPYTHVRVDPTQRDYFSSRGGVNYVHPEQGIPRGVPVTRSPEREGRRDRDRDRDRDREDRFDRYGRRHTSSSDEPAHRRRSHDHPYFPQETRSSHLPHRIPEHHPPPRRHSQPRHISSSSSETEDSPISPGTVRHRRRSHHSTEPPHSRRPYDLDGGRIGSSHSHLPTIAVPLPHEHGRRGSRQDDSKRSTLVDIKDKVLSYLPVGGSDRQRSGSRGRKDEGLRADRHAEPKGRNHPTRLRGSWSDYNSEESDSDDSRRRRQKRLEKEREREREREKDKDRIRDRDFRDRDRDKTIARDREKSAHLRDRPRDRDSDEKRDRERDRYRDRHGPDRAQPRSREPSDEDLSPKSRARGSGGSSNRYLGQPDDGFRRTSSHADISRKRDWDSRDHERHRDEKYRDRDRDRDRDLERERERERERTTRLSDRMPSPGKGVKGRVYPIID